MVLEERIEKMKNEKQNLESKREKLTERIRQIDQKIAEAEEELKNKKNDRVVKMIEEKIGELDEEKLQFLDQLLLTSVKEKEENFADPDAGFSNGQNFQEH